MSSYMQADSHRRLVFLGLFSMTWQASGLQFDIGSPSLSGRVLNGNRMWSLKGLIKFGSTAFVAAACAHFYQLVLELRSLGRAAELGILTSSFFAWLQISFILAFTISAISLLVNRTLGRIGALLGLFIVLLNYAVWCAFSYRSLQLIAGDTFYREHPEYVPPFMLGLLGAQWWDFLALILTFIVLVYVLCEPWIRPQRVIK